MGTRIGRRRVEAIRAMVGCEQFLCGAVFFTERATKATVNYSSKLPLAQGVNFGFGGWRLANPNSLGRSEVERRERHGRLAKEPKWSKTWSTGERGLSFVCEDPSMKCNSHD